MFLRRMIFRDAALLALLAATPAEATETVTYTYDALGRLVQSSTAGSVNNGLVAATSYDPADNRANYTVTGSANSSPPVQVIVVPLAGFTIIPLSSVVQ